MEVLVLVVVTVQDGPLLLDGVRPHHFYHYFNYPL
jgi:hypothetical protein